MMGAKGRYARAFVTVVQLAGLSLGVVHAEPAPTYAAEAPQARNVILMIADGAGFNGWLATDYYEGRARVPHRDQYDEIFRQMADGRLNVIMGAGSTLFRQFERHDAFARTLWGEPYGWDGDYVDNTAIFHVMNAVFANEHRARKAAPAGPPIDIGSS